MSVVLTGARVVVPEGVLDDGWVSVDGRLITGVGSGPAPAGSAVALGGAWLLPGYIDVHVHGGGGHDMGASLEDMAAAVAFHRGHGTTRTLVSLVAAPLADLRRRLDWVAELTARGPSRDGHVLGAHLEGPFLSHPRCGAQNPAHLLEPDLTAFAGLVEAARGCLRSVTLAPELPGASELVRAVVSAGAVAAIGHTDAGFHDAATAIADGVTLATHLFNGMRPVHHRRPGAVTAALTGDVWCEIINDAVHVHPAITSLVARATRRLVLVTDAIDATGAGDGDFVLGGQAVRVRHGQARLVAGGALAGSTLTMDDAVRRAVRDCGLPIEVASAAASGNPAQVLGIADQVGAIAPGLAADLVVLDDELRVRDVMAAGEWCGRR